MSNKGKKKFIIEDNYEENGLVSINKYMETMRDNGSLEQGTKTHEKNIKLSDEEIKKQKNLLPNFVEKKKK